MSLKYTKMKIFHFKEKIDSLPKVVGEVLPPIHIRIKPTNVCNHNCSYCAYRVENQELGKDMVQKDYIPKEKMLEILDDIIEMDVKAVTFSGGGEPFCYPYFLDAVKRLSQSQVPFSSLTNGSLLEGEVSEIFAHYATWLRISIDGWDNKSYASYRRIKKNGFSKLIENIENFKKIGGKCLLGVSIIVDKKNASHIYEMLVLFRNSGVNSVKISPCIVSNIGKENNEYHSPIFDKVKEQVKKSIEDIADDKFEIFDSYHELDQKFKKDYTWCPYLQILPVIGADLNVYSCQDKAYNLDEGLIGSIKHQRFKEFWFSDKNKFFKIQPSENCNHHCVANTKNRLILEYVNADKEHLGFV